MSDLQTRRLATSTSLPLGKLLKQLIFSFGNLIFWEELLNRNIFNFYGKSTGILKDDELHCIKPQ